MAITATAVSRATSRAITSCCSIVSTEDVKDDVDALQSARLDNGLVEGTRSCPRDRIKAAISIFSHLRFHLDLVMVGVPPGVTESFASSWSDIPSKAL